MEETTLLLEIIECRECGRAVNTDKKQMPINKAMEKHDIPPEAIERKERVSVKEYVVCSEFCSDG